MIEALLSIQLLAQAPCGYGGTNPDTPGGCVINGAHLQTVNGVLLIDPTNMRPAEESDYWRPYSSPSQDNTAP